MIGGDGVGIGRAITAAYAAEGAAVAVADVDQGRAEEAADAVRRAGRPAAALVGDVRSSADVDAIVDGAAHALGGLEVLVTVVGAQVAFVPAARVHEMTDADWDLVLDVNVRYVFRAVRAALRVFLAQGTGGTIVSVGSVTGFMAAPEEAAQVPLGRFGTVADVARAAVYLGSRESSYVTGQRLVVDGGVSVRGPFA